VADLVLPIDLAYAAGIIDGEGTIGISELSPGGLRSSGRPSRKSPQFRPYVSVIMVDPGIPAWLSETFGGPVHGYEPRQPHHKPIHKWTLNNQRAVTFCRLIQPHLRLKGAQAQLVIDYYDGRFDLKRRSAGLPQEEILARRDFVTQIHALNGRGARGGQ
jgi:hypothetical protein